MTEIDEIKSRVARLPPERREELRVWLAEQASRPVRSQNKAEIIAALQENAEPIRKLGATALYVYGSVARDEMHDDSDVDVFIDYDPTNGDFDFVAFCRIEELVKSILDREVDFTTRGGLHPLLRERIEKSSARVF
jgi:uncharacterized protein